MMLKAFAKKILSWSQPGVKIKMIVIPDANHQTAFPTTAIQGLDSQKNVVLKRCDPKFFITELI